jgi:hypothetical protein
MLNASGSFKYTISASLVGALAEVDQVRVGGARGLAEAQANNGLGER